MHPRLLYIVVGIEKGAFWSPSTTVINFTFLYYYTTIVIFSERHHLLYVPLFPTTTCVCVCVCVFVCARARLDGVNIQRIYLFIYDNMLSSDSSFFWAFFFFWFTCLLADVEMRNPIRKLYLKKKIKTKNEKFIKALVSLAAFSFKIWWR